MEAWVKTAGKPYAMKWSVMIVLVVVGMLATGCASTGARREKAAMPDRPREAVRIFDREGHWTSWATMLAKVSQADVIVIGETHSHPLGLAAAASLWDDVLQIGSRPALLMEFFERDQQVALDDYLTGVTDEDQFEKAAGRGEGNYPPGHRRMIEAAKAAGAPVFAANAPRRYVRRTSPEGFEALTGLRADQQQLFELPEPMIEGRYRDEFFAQMREMEHGLQGQGGMMPPGMVEKMYRSQQVWDATMADSVARAVDGGYRPAVLVVGRFHSDFDGGTVQLIHRDAPGASVRTVSMVASDATTLAPEDVGRADFIVYVGAEAGE